MGVEEEDNQSSTSRESCGIKAKKNPMVFGVGGVGMSSKEDMKFTSLHVNIVSNRRRG